MADCPFCYGNSVGGIQLCSTHRAQQLNARSLSPALEQAIRSRIRDYCNSQMHKYGANLGAEIDELQWVLTQAGLEPEKE